MGNLDCKSHYKQHSINSATSESHLAQFKMPTLKLIHILQNKCITAGTKIPQVSNNQLISVFVGWFFITAEITTDFRIGRFVAVKVWQCLK